MHAPETIRNDRGAPARARGSSTPDLRPLHPRRKVLGRTPLSTLALALTAALAAPVHAQSPEALKPGAGDRIRVTTQGQEAMITTEDGRRVGRQTAPAERIDGELVAWERDRLVIRPPGQAADRSIPLATLERLELHAGRKSRPVRGLLIGGAVGSGVGLAVGLLAMADDGGFIDFGPEILAPSAAIFGGVGAFTGLIIGSTPRDGWEEVPLDGLAARVGATPGGDVQVALSLPLP